MNENTTASAHTAATDIGPLLGYLKRTRGIDYGSYKHSTLERRIRKRMQMLNVEHYDDYIDYLEVHPDEFKTLFNHILINMTDFFRDEPAWRTISNDIVPRILASKKPGEQVRVWSAGCASGQEAYTIAMVLCEAMGEAALRQQVKIYATDADEEALNEARMAVYSADHMKSVPDALRDKYFESNGGRFAFKKEMRRAVIFGRHDLLTDAPISRIDLLICRNTLMYFNTEAQTRILSRFGFALHEHGFLFLGKAEVMAARSDAFVPVDLKSRIFAKATSSYEGNINDGGRGAGDGRSILETDDAILHSLALEVDVTPQIVVNARNELVLINAPARSLLGLRTAGSRQRLQDLLIAYRPIELRHMIEQVNAERSALQQRDVKWILPTGEEHFFDVSALPLIDAAGNLLGVKIAFVDVSILHKLQAELQHLHHELETLNEELQSSNEELETTNEELQSTNEELETTNEELQSTNEELETMNEELQSTNEELGTVNDELRQRGQDLNRTNAFLQSIMYGIREGLIVLDRNLQVQAWNRMAENLWGLRADEVVGQHFFNLDIGLPVDKLNTMIRTTLNEGSWDNLQEVALEAVNRRGRPIAITVTATPLMEDETRQGVILVVKEIGPGQKLISGEASDEPDR
jgi:two-component system CheB/CheR fusion protein